MPGLDDIVKQAIATMPEPSPIADEEVKTQEPHFGIPDSEKRGEVSDALNPGVIRDAKGNRFDPAIHADPNRRNRDGSFSKKRGRKAGSTGGGSGSSRKAVDSSREAGKAAAHATFMLGVVIGGEEWQPVIDEKNGLNEPLTMEQAWTAWFDEQGITEFPAWVQLVIVMTAYSAPRMFMPKTKSRLKKAVRFFAKKVLPHLGKRR